MKQVLDVACGARSFYFNREDPRVLFVDNRTVAPKTLGRGESARVFEVQPDIVADFRDLPFTDASFPVVVFDPPHLLQPGPKSYMGEKYGALDPKHWRDDLKKGFAECFRVLRPEGVLIFKWNETDIQVHEILKLTPHAPLFGHRTGKTHRTHWVAFIKP